MPAVLQLGCTIQCPHGGTVVAASSNLRVRVAGVVALLQDDSFTVVGCPLVIATKPQPCVKVIWEAPATKVEVAGRPVLLTSSLGLCQSAEQAVQGTVLVNGVQTRVQGV